MEYKNIKFEIKEHIAYLTLSRPEALNSLNHETTHELELIFDHIADDRIVLGVIITGEGKAFCAGTDITEITQETPGKSPNLSERFSDYVNGIHRIFSKIENFERPVIAAVNGFALGGGCELAMCCDLRIANSKAAFGQPEVNLGVMACYGGTQRLPKIVGVGMAKEMLYTGRMVKAIEAKEIGLVNRIVEPEELLNAAEEMMKTIISKGPLAVKYTKVCVNKGLEVSLAYGLEYEKNMIGIILSTDDAMEGINAFMEKRTPNYQNK